MILCKHLLQMNWHVEYSDYFGVSRIESTTESHNLVNDFNAETNCYVSLRQYFAHNVWRRICIWRRQRYTKSTFPQFLVPTDRRDCTNAFPIHRCLCLSAHCFLSQREIVRTADSTKHPLQTLLIQCSSISCLHRHTEFYVVFACR